MEEPEFDRFAEEYRNLHASNIRASGEGPEFFAEYKVADVASTLGDVGRSRSLRILDFGAGIGTSVPYFRKYFPNALITCLDVSRRSLELGQSRFPGQAEFVHFDGHRIPFDDGSFDLAFAACVFHHIPHDEHPDLLREMARAIKRPGHIFVFEHNPYNPLTARAVRDCPFDENAKLIPAGQLRRQLSAAAGMPAQRHFRIFFPGFARALRPAESLLRWLPLGAQYYVHAQFD